MELFLHRQPQSQHEVLSQLEYANINSHNTHFIMRTRSASAAHAASSAPVPQAATADTQMDDDSDYSSPATSPHKSTSSSNKSRKAMSKTALLKASKAENRTYPYRKQQATVPKGTHRTPDPHDYGTKYEHGPMYIRDTHHPFIHYCTRYSPELEIFLLAQSPINHADPPRYSYIRTTTHPTHKIVGGDVKTYHQLKDSGFRYQEKFPHCVRICLDGMGKSGSSNRPYALCARDFELHFDQIAKAHRGEKKAKRCLYEQLAHKPRIDWLQQLCHLVYGTSDAPDGAFDSYDHTKYQKKSMVFDGTKLKEFDGVNLVDLPPSSAPAASTATEPEVKRPRKPAQRKSTKAQAPKRMPSLECHEALTSSDDETETTLEGTPSSTSAKPAPRRNTRGGGKKQYNEESKTAAEETKDEDDDEEMSVPTLDNMTSLSSPKPDRAQSITQMHVPLFRLSAASSLMPPIATPSTNLPASFVPFASTSFALQPMNSLMSPPAPPARLPSDMFATCDVTVDSSSRLGLGALQMTPSTAAAVPRLESNFGLSWQQSESNNFLRQPSIGASSMAPTSTLSSSPLLFPSASSAAAAAVALTSTPSTVQPPSSLCCRAGSISGFFVDESSRHSAATAVQ